VTAAGWSVGHIGHGDGMHRGERWLEVLATRS
jgi:hypothetical protein